MKSLSKSLVRHAHAIAREVGARAVLLSADVVEADEDLAALIEDVGFRVLLVSRRPAFAAPDGWGDLCTLVRVPDVPMTRAGQIKLATLVAAAEGLIQRGDRVVCLSGLDGSGILDTLLVLDLGSEAEFFAVTAAEPLPEGVAPAVFQRVLSLAAELGLEGREGRPVGAMFVVGDADRVWAQSHQLVINPFHGYAEAELNVLDPRMEETIKEFSAIDGAFLIRGDGVILSAGRYLCPRVDAVGPLPQGLGARHEAAAGITLATDAMALSVSQSTGTVSVFRRGKLVADIPKPRSRAAREL